MANYTQGQSPKEVQAPTAERQPKAYFARLRKASKGMASLMTLTALIATLFASPALAQRQGNVWIFGGGAALDFNSGSPVLMPPTPMWAYEGCASVSDSAGQLLFYTNGRMVWDRANNLMPNGVGLMGDSSATHSGLTVPWPGHPNKYYVFTVDKLGGPDGLRYTVVDMALNNGFGDVDTNQKNVLLHILSTERMTAVRKRGSQDAFWLISHDWMSAQWRVFSIDSNGVDTANPVLTTIGAVHTTNINGSENAIGYLKASPNGKRLAVALHGSNRFEIFDFNDSTGVISGNKALTDPDYDMPYGVEFSADGNILYGSCFQSRDLWQWDLLAGNAAAIKATGVRVGVSPFYLGAIQLAPNGKMYVARCMSRYLGVVDQPNDLGITCAYNDIAVDLFPRTARFGLPTFVQSFFRRNFQVSQTCHGGPTSFHISDSSAIDSVKWFFGDGTSASGFYVSHNYAIAGYYTVQMLSYRFPAIDTATEIVWIRPQPTDVINDTVALCGGPALLDAQNPGANYLWSTGATTQTISVSTPGIYTVDINNSCGVYHDTIVVQQGKHPGLLGPDTTLCYGVNYTLQAPAGSTAFWSTGVSANSITINQSGTYTVTLYTAGCLSLDTVTVTYLPQPPPLALGNDTMLCPMAMHTLNAGPANGYTYLWSTGATSSSIVVSQPGSYSVVRTSGCFTVTDTINVDYYFALTPLAQKDTALCGVSPIVVDVAMPGATTYSWAHGPTTSAITITQPGIYIIEVTSQCQVVRDTFEVIEILQLTTTWPNDTAICSGEAIVFDGSCQTCNVLWGDGETDEIRQITQPGEYSVTIDNGCSQRSFSFTVNLWEIPTNPLGNDTIICSGEEVKVDVRNRNAIVTWNDGKQGGLRTLRAAGTYIINVWTPCGTYADTLVLKHFKKPVSEMPIGAELCGSGQVSVVATTEPNVSVVWEDGSTNPTRTFNKEGTYIATLTEECETTTDTFLVGPCGGIINLTNVFTPNGDGMNDRYMPTLVPGPDFSLVLVDRWGSPVFRTERSDNGWDGGTATPGTYFAVITNFGKVVRTPVELIR